MKTIPPIAHFIWIGPKEPPASLRDAVAAVRFYHPKWKIRVWTNEDVARLPFFGKYLGRIQPWACMSNMARVEIMAAHGGYYLDTDMTITRPLDTTTGIYLGRCAHPKWLATSFFGARPDHPFFRRIVQRIASTVDRLPFGARYTPHFTGSGLWEKVFATLPLRPPVRYRTIYRFSVNPSLEGMGFIIDGRTKNLVAAHRNHLSWMGKRLEMLPAPAMDYLPPEEESSSDSGSSSSCSEAAL